MTTDQQRLAQGLLDYLADIPEEKWIRGMIEDYGRPGSCCALGHIGAQRK